MCLVYLPFTLVCGRIFIFSGHISILADICLLFVFGFAAVAVYLLVSKMQVSSHKKGQD